MAKDQGAASPGPGALTADFGLPRHCETPLTGVRQALDAELGWLQGDPTGTAALTIEVVGQPFSLQFIGNDLLLDLPEASLSTEAAGRARVVMERCGVPLSMLKVTTEQGEEATLRVYQASLAGEVEEAVRLSLAVLHEIFLPEPEAKVRITRIQ
jgi:hypothetical protein